MNVAAADPIPPGLRPIRLPEFDDIEFGWGLCSNSMCLNYCVLYGYQDDPRGDGSRYKEVRQGGVLTKLTCRVCGLNIKQYSARSLREIARHFLSESLPFVDCRNAACENHGVNAFEFYGRRCADGRIPYRQAARHELLCNVCNEPFSLGVPIWLQDLPKVRRQVKDLIHSVAMGRPFTDAYESGIDSYYPRLFRASSRLRDYLSYRNAGLLRPLPGGEREQQTAKVYTDVFHAPLRASEDGRAKGLQLRVIVSTVELEGTYYILAAHVYFLPDAKCPSLDELERDKENPDRLVGRWDALRTFLDTDQTLTDEGVSISDVPDEGQPGQEILSPYAETAHFLVVDRMLSRFGRRFYYMDTSQRLFDSAVAAMRRAIVERRVEIVLYQHEKSGWRQSDTPFISTKRRNKSTLMRAFKESEAVFAERLKDAMQFELDEQSKIKVRSVLWRRARRGGYSDLALGVWLKFPPNYGTYINCRTWWFTRRPNDTPEDGVDVLLAAAMKSVDSAHASMRRRVNGMARRISTAREVRGSGLGDTYYRFDVVCAELWIYLIYFNFRTRRRDPPGTLPRAVAMGLAEKRDGTVRAHNVAWTFRLGVEHAKEISRWLTAR